MSDIDIVIKALEQSKTALEWAQETIGQRDGLINELLEALKREHQIAAENVHHPKADCPVCQLIGRCSDDA